MRHKALYREWRPRTFDEIVEQQYTVAALKQAVISKNIAHAYLFSGTRGTGKTTMAQIFSRAVNCISPVNGNPCNKCNVCTGILDGTILDVIEMDAASNNSVDAIRRMCDEVIFSPSIAKFKIYIIDEVHMLSTGAFNALLKTLEEPPAHAIFILATTEPHRIPATILSRCQRYEFRRISVDSIVKRLKDIAISDGIDVEDSALSLIARISDGALRDAISLLDQAKGSFAASVSKDDILALVGMVKDDFMNELVRAMLSGSPGKVLDLIDKLLMDGRDIVRFSLDLAGFFRNIMVCMVSSKPESILALSDKSLSDLKEISDLCSLDYVILVIRKLSSLNSELRWSSNPRITFETNLISLMESTKPSSTPTNATPEPKKETPKKIEPVKREVKEEIKEDVSLENENKETKKEDSTLLWNKVLDSIIATGQMTVFLFLQPAEVSIKDLGVNICFSAKDQMNFEEIGKEKNIQIISKAFLDITNTNYNIKTTLISEDKAFAENDATNTENKKEKKNLSLENLKDSAEELGIPFSMEEE